MPDYFDKGFCVRRPSWHSKETILQDFPEDWSMARELAGLDWEPATQVPYQLRVYAEGETPPEGSHFIGYDTGTRHQAGKAAAIHAVPVPGFQLVTRDDTNDVLSIPTAEWQPIYHRQMGELLDAAKQADKALKFDSVGSAAGGRRTWVVCLLDEPYTVPGDESATYPFLVALNSHDSSGAMKIMPTDIRVVCWNTWHAADSKGERTGHQIVIRHVGDTAAKVEKAKEAIAATRTASKAWQLEAEDLAAINVNDTMIATFLDQFIPVPDNASARTRSNREQRRSLFMEVLGGPTVGETLGHTAYGVVQAAGEYLDHLRPMRSPDTYLARTLFSAEPIKGHVITLVRELAGDPQLQAAGRVHSVPADWSAN